MATEQYNDTNATVSGNEELNEALGTVTPQGVEMRIAQASGDPVPIDVGESEPESGAEAEVAVEIPAEVTPDAGNVVRLPEGVSIEDIRVDGPNLVLVQPDGSRVTVLNAALNIPTFVIGDVEIAPEVLVAALEAQGIDVAAGPDGTFSVVSGTTSSNPNFSEAIPGIGDAGPPIDLLPPTALAFEQLDGEELGPLDVSGPEFGDFGGDFLDGGFLRLLEPSLDKNLDGDDIQAGTTTGTDPEGTGETRIGTIALTAGTSAVTSVYFFNPSSPSFVAPVISGVEPGTPALTWTMNPEGQLIGSLNGVQVVIMEITAPLPIPATQTADVTIKVTLLDAFPHAEGEGPNEVTISGIQIGATDANGLSASTTFGVIIVDDVPVDEGGDRDWTLDEDVLPGGNDDLDVPADTNDYLVLTDKDLGIDWGADGPGGATFNDPVSPVVVRDGDGNPVAGPLSSGGVPLFYSIVTNADGGQTLTATKGDGGEVVFTLTIDPDGGENGQFDFTLSGTLDHPMANGQNTLQLHFPFTATDGDGDPIGSSIVIRVTDDVPYVVPSNFLFNGDFSDLPGSGTDYGDYFISSVLPGWTIAQSPEGDPSGTPQFEIVDNGYLGMSVPSGNAMIDLGASPGNVQISQNVAGLTAGQQYAIQFYAGAPYPDTAGLKVFWGGELIATIEPGSVMTAYTLIVTAGGNPGDNQLTFMEIGTGNDPIPGSATEGYHGTYLADIAVKAVNFVDEDGLPAGIGDSQTGDAVVPDVDGDGNEATTIGSLGILWGADNTDLPDTGGLQDGANTELFGRHVVFTNANVTVAGAAQAELTSGGVPVTYVLSHNNTVLTGMAGDKAVFRVTLFDDGQGSYKFELLAELDHAPGANENDIVLGFNFTATDFDGDSATGSFLIGIDDDVPVVDVESRDRSTVTHDESAWPQNALWNFFGPSGDRNDDDVGVIASVLKVSQLFSGVGDRGDDPDVPALAKAFFHGAIGYAQSQASLVTVNVNYGADGPAGSNALVYSLKLGDGVSGLKTTEGHDIVLSKEGALIVGRVVGGDHDGQAAIAIHVDPETGKVTIAQWLSLEHPNTASHDEGISLGEGAVLVEVTVTDGDGDTHSDSVDVSNQIRFEDDGPKLEKFQLKSGAKVVHDETPGVDGDANDTDADLAALFSGIGPVAQDPDVPDGAIGYAKVSGGSLFHVSADFGSDGPLDGGYAYTLEIGTKTTSLKTTEGHAIELKLVDGIIVGVVKDGPFAGKAAFAIHIDEASGDVTLAQYLSLQHPINPDNHDEAVWLAANNVKVRLTVTDGDGDTDSEVVSIGGKIGFQDDGPTADDTDAGKILDDEAQPGGVYGGPGDNGWGKSVSGQLDIDGGSDGIKSITFSKYLTVKNENGETVGLKAIWVDGEGVGHPRDVTVAWTQNGVGGTLVGTADDIGNVFELTVNADGSYTFKLLAPLSHPLTTDGDAFVGSYEDLLALGFKFTVTDGDGDKASAKLTIEVDDDSPMILGIEQVGHGPNLVKNGSFEDGHSLTGSNWDIFKSIDHWSQGADKVPFEVQTGGAGGVPAQDGNAIIELDGDTQTNNQGGNGTPQSATNATIQQAIEGTVAGQAYKLTFHYAIRPEGVGNSGMEVWFGGVKVYTIADNAGIPANVWQQITIDVTAPANDAVLEFRGTGTQNEFGALLDNVSMHGISPILIHDETQGVQVGADPNNQDDVAGAGLPGNILALFNAIAQKGSDGDVDPKDNNAIGFARSGAENPAFQFSAKFGADGKHASAAVAYALQTTDGTDSGLKTTEGQAILLYNEGGLIVGRVEGSEGKAAFAIAIDPATGELFLAQYLSIEHGFAGDGSNGSHDELATILSGAIKATVTIKDGDSDSVTSDAVSIGHLIGFQDDGPSVSLDGSNALANGLFFDGFTPNNNAWGIGSGVATGTAGEWTITASPTNGAANPELQKVASGYRGATSPTGSLIVDMEASPGNIQITQDVSGLVDGHTYRLSFEIGEAADADPASSAILEVWWNGNLIGTYNPASGLMQTIVVDVVAGAGPNELQFREVGASGDNTGTFLANVKLSDVIIIDETPGLDADADDTADPLVAALFNGINGGLDPHMAAQFAQGSKAVVSPTIDFGSDGPATGAGGGIAYSLSIVEGADSGLTTTEGQPILLYLDGAGRVIGVYDGGGAAGKVAIAFHIDPATGFTSVAQYVSLAHPDTGKSDEGIYLKPGSLGVTVTVTDGDGDTASASTDISGLVRFEDDGPTAVDTVAGKILDDERQAGGINDGPGDETGGNYRFVKGKLDIDGGADGVKSIVFAEAVTAEDENGAAIVQLQAIHVDPVTKLGTPRDVALAWQADGNGGGTLTGTATDIGTVFELTVDKDGNYTFKLFAPLSHPLTTDGDAFVGSYEDLLALGFSFTVTDGDGDEATATLTIKVDDDSPMLGEGGIEALSDIASGPGTHTGTIDFKPGADGIGKALLLANNGREPAGLEFEGQQVKYFVDENNPHVLIAHVGDDPSNESSHVFKLTVDPVAGNYELEIFKQLDFVTGGGSTTIGNGTAYGTSDVASADLEANGIELGTVTGFTADGIDFGSAASINSWITAWLGGSPNLDPSTVNGSNQGWGAAGNNALGEGEFLRFDFTGGEVPPQSTAFALNNFPQAGSVVIYWKVTYSDGSTDDGIVNDPAPSSQALAIPGLDGETIKTVEFFIREPGTGQGGKIDLVSVTTGEQITDILLDFGLTLTDGDGDGVTGKIEITLDGYQAPTGPTGDPLALKVKEEALDDGGSNPTSDAEKDEGTLTFIQGSAPLTFAFAGTPVVTNALGNPVAQITSWVLSPDGQTYTGFIGSTEVVKLTLVAGTPGAGGEIDVTVKVELLDNIPGHSNTGNDFITVTGIVVEADDGTGNPLGSVNGQLTIQVKDDVPEVDAFVRTELLSSLNLTVDETDDAAGTDRYAPGETTDDGNPDGNGGAAGLGSVSTSITGGLWALFGHTQVDGADGWQFTGTSLRLRLVGADPVDGTLETTVKTIGGETIYLKLGAGDASVTGVADGVTIFTIDFTFGPELRLTMFEPIMHGDNSRFDENEVLKLAGDGAVQLVYRHEVTDRDGDQASDEVAIDLVTKSGGFFSFDDDGPIAANDIATLGNALETVSGNVIAGTVDSGTGGADSPGSDGGAISKIAFGATEQSSFNSDGDLVITTDNGTLKIKADGSYTYTRANDDPVTVDEVFTYTLKDGDGDTTTATLTVKIADKGVTIGDLRPAANGGDAIVFEKGLAARSGEPAGSGETGDGSANADPSESTPGWFTFTSPDGLGTLTIGTTVITLAELQAAAGTPITIAGGPVYGKLEITGFVGSTTGGQVNYRFTLLDNVAHPLANATGPADQLFVDYNVVVEDADGDSQGSTLSIAINDDGPKAKDDTDAFGAGNVGTTIDGNVVTGVGTAGGAANADVTGADGFGSIVWTGVNAGVIQGSFGYLTVDANGGYVYTRTSPAGGNDVFNYTLVDGDGDQSPAKLTITLTNIALPTVSNPSVVADEDDIPVIGNDNTDSPGDAAQSGLTGSLGSYGPDGKGAGGGVSFADLHGDPVTAPGYASVESGGNALTYFWDAASSTLYGTTNGANATTAANNAAFKIVVDQSDASYTFTLLKPLEHKENSTEDDIDLSISYKITDATGDTVPGTMSVKIDDDMPIAQNESATVVSGQSTAGKIDLVLVVDISQSMTEVVAGTGGKTRITLAREALQQLVSNEAVDEVKIVLFRGASTSTLWMTKAQALTFIGNASNFNSANISASGTNYDAALFTGSQSADNAFDVLPSTPADDRYVFFLSDGEPTSSANGINAAEEANWISFLTNNNVKKSVAIGFGDLNTTNQNQLEPIAWQPGESAGSITTAANDDNVIIIPDGQLPNLGNILEAQLETADGNVLTNDKFGADGGRLLSITVDGETYTYDPAAAGPKITAPDETAITARTATSVTILTEGGGTLTFYFAQTGGNAAGSWEYTPPANVAADFAEQVNYVLVDGDGDTASATLTINVVLPPNFAPDAQNDTINGIVEAFHNDAGSLTAGTSSNSVNVLTNDQDPGDTLKVTQITAPGGGSPSAVPDGGSVVVQGVYGTLTIHSNGTATYNLMNSLASTQALQAGQTVTEVFTYQATDSGGLSDTASITVNIAGRNDAPVIWSPAAHNYVGNTGTAHPIHVLKFSDVDSPGIVTVTLLSDDTGARFYASDSAGVTVWGNGEQFMDLRGTIADINAFIAAKKLTYAMNDSSQDTIMVIINDGNGGTDSQTFTVSPVTIDWAQSGQSSTNHFPGGSIFHVGSASQDAGNGDDLLSTSWSHGVAVTYTGGNGSDTIRAVFNADQLNEVLNFNLNTVREFYDGSPNSGMNLSGTSWNASVSTNWEVAQLGLAAPRYLGTSGGTADDNYINLGTWIGSGSAIGTSGNQVATSGTAGASFSGNSSNNLIVGGAGNQTLNGGNGDDVLVAFHTAGNTLNGGAGADLLLGGDGDDILIGGIGNDVLAGGKGADTFVFGELGAANRDIIADYDFTEGDIIDLSNLLDAAFAPGSNIANFVQVSATNTNDLLVRVDTTGSGSFGSSNDVVTIAGGNTNGADPVRLLFGDDEHIVTG
jgi:T1SS-143 domain-containing protein